MRAGATGQADLTNVAVTKVVVTKVRSGAYVADPLVGSVDWGDMRQRGPFGAVVHLCSRLVGDEVRTSEIPDNNGEAAFASFREVVGR